MSNEIFDALSLLEKERGIPVDFMMDKIKKAILTACKNSYGNDDATIDVNPETGAFGGAAEDGCRGRCLRARP